MNIKLLPPDINESSVRFTVVNGKIRFGLAAVKNVGEGPVRGIIEEKRKNGSFKGFRDFLERIDGRDINKRCIESLIKSGAFDSFGIFRSKLLASYEKMIDGIQQNKKRNMDGQVSIFEFDGGNKKEIPSREDYPDLKEYPPKILLAMEKEMLGLYISGHPLKEFENDLNAQVSLFSSSINANRSEGVGEEVLAELENVRDGMPVTVGGIIALKKTKTTKNNNLMAFITLEDLYGYMEVIVFPTIYERFSNLIVEENIVIINGRISLKEEEQPKIICEEIKPVKKVAVKKVYVRLKNNKPCHMLDSLMSMFRYFNGNTPVCLYSEEDKSVKVLEREFWVSMNDYLLKELKERLGEENVKVV
jgi:DNA polymerase-3 subunit alpha